MTVDLEDWFHCMAPDDWLWPTFERRAELATERMLMLLDEVRARATFFVLGDVAEHAPHLVRAIHNAGHEIGSHGMWHRFIHQQTPAAFREELHASRALLEDQCAAPVMSYRAPYFSITQSTRWALDVLAEQGFRRDSSVFPARNPRYGISNSPRLPHEIRSGLNEWPVSTLPSPLGNIPIGGGVYLRVLPLTFFESAISRLEQRGEPVVLYVHPWEIDAGQPRYRSGSRFLDLRHYWRLGDTERRLRRVLSRACYTSLESAEASSGLA